MSSCIFTVPNDLKLAKFYESDQIQLRPEVIDFGANLTAKCIDIMKFTKQKDNLKAYERESFIRFRDLVKRKRIVLTPWDKGQGMCILPHNFYMAQVETEILKSYVIGDFEKNTEEFEKCQDLSSKLFREVAEKIKFGLNLECC